MSDPYQILGVEKNATEEQIKKAYRRLAKTYHPDVNKEPGAEIRFKEIQTAFEAIGDPQKRENYDRFGTTESTDQFGHDVSDIFNGFFNRTRQVEVGQIMITLEECVLGCNKNFTLTTNGRCPTCSGSGSSESTVCQHCGGRGTRNVSQGPFLAVEEVISESRLVRIAAEEVKLSQRLNPWKLTFHRAADQELGFLSGELPRKNYLSRLLFKTIPYSKSMVTTCGLTV
jgi:DnaJ-class molecular chaperone